MIVREEHFRSDTIHDIAKKIAVAARTAPKARGTDNLEIAVLTGDDISLVAEKMKRHAAQTGEAFFARDAENILLCEAVVLIGSHVKPLGLNCGYCGFPTCAEKLEHPGVPCFFNANDMGIAIGSAVSKAADFRIDNRVMFSVGNTAKEMNLLPDCVMVLAIPLTAKGKSPFFDRK